VTRQNTLLIALVACAFLQADLEARQAVGTTTGAISGKVTDSSGAVLPGVRITSSSDAVIGNGGTRATVTAGNGLYRFPALPPSEYSLLFVLGGFRTSSREGIHVGVGFTATVNVVLEVAAVNESVNVERRSPVIDTQSTVITTGFDVRQLTNLPGSRSLFAILTATPAVQVERFEVGGSSGDSGPPYSAYGHAPPIGQWSKGLMLPGSLLPASRSITDRSTRYQWARPCTAPSGRSRASRCKSSASRVEIVTAALSMPTTRTTIGNRSTSTRIR
jgi:Carboxypeptidase regulatory-like domain